MRTKKTKNETRLEILNQIIMYLGILAIAFGIIINILTN